MTLFTCCSTPSKKPVGDAVLRDTADPAEWIVVFRPTSTSWLVQMFVPGRFKHVAACAHLPALNAWVTYDVGFDGTKITVIPDGPQVNAVLAPWLDGCTLVRMAKRPTRGIPWFGWCAPSIARLIGLRGGTLRGDSLYRQCLRNGGILIDGRQHQRHADTPAAAPG